MLIIMLGEIGFRIHIRPSPDVIPMKRDWYAHMLVTTQRSHAMLDLFKPWASFANIRSI
jgi:hypothetical protein